MYNHTSRFRFSLFYNVTKYKEKIVIFRKSTISKIFPLDTHKTASFYATLYDRCCIYEQEQPSFVWRITRMRLQSYTRGVYSCKLIYCHIVILSYHMIYNMLTSFFSHCIYFNWSKAVFNHINRRKCMVELKKDYYIYRVSRKENWKENGCFFLKMANNRVVSVKNSPRLLFFFIIRLTKPLHGWVLWWLFFFSAFILGRSCLDTILLYIYYLDFII